MTHQENIRKTTRYNIITSIIGIVLALICLFFVLKGGENNQLIGLYLSVVALFFCIHIPFAINYIKTQSALSDEMKEMIANEMDDPRTIYYKRFNLYLTPNYLVSIKGKLLIAPYSDITWVYDQKERTRGGSIRVILIYLRNFKCYRTAMTSEYAPLETPFTHKDVLDELSRRNPRIIIGYTPELKKQYKQAKKQYRA